MVIGAGIDLVELDRVAQALARWDDRLIGKLMDEAEARRLPAEGQPRVRAMALAIAAKEAASKALGTGWSAGVRWRDVEVWLRPEAGVRLLGAAAARARSLGSAGACVVGFQERDGIVPGEVWLLAGEAR